MANNEVLALLRPYIANSGLPTKKELNVIIKSVSRTYNILPYEMHTVDMFYEDLVVEFVENLYIPNDIKKHNINQILESMDNTNESLSECKEERYPFNKTNLDGKHGNNITSLLLGALSGVCSMLAGLLTSMNLGNKFNLIMWIINMLIVGIAIIANLIVLLKPHKKRRKFDICSKEYTNIDNLRMRNCGKDLKTIYNHDFVFVNYFKGCD